MHVAEGPGVGMKTAVLITLRDDLRVLRALKSLDAQQDPPDRVLVADGGSTDGSWEAVEAYEAGFDLCLEELPGSVAETRAAAVPLVTEDVLAFLDADEVAPPGWLARLVAPIRKGSADVVGGPTRPLAHPRSRAEAYVNDFEAWFYQHIVVQDPTMLPMGNSAWLRRVFDEAGQFDARLRWGGEDYDMNLRAADSGFRFAYEPDAWVWHDQSHLNTMGKLWQRARRYSKGATMAYMKNGVLRGRIRPAISTSARFHHPYRVPLAASKAVGFVQGWWAWRRCVRH